MDGLFPLPYGMRFVLCFITLIRNDHSISVLFELLFIDLALDLAVERHFVSHGRFVLCDFWVLIRQTVALGIDFYLVVLEIDVAGRQTKVQLAQSAQVLSYHC
jgi:hypothetical protein